ncbi:hypothetical protein DTO164E3_7993 [Paecilomyces variotii]|nr:hypothetical protein DTO032I3_8083 [Paecilomyces variotii]KAJ9193169.1 hypothetical protein DTO164E3_7993 [Paecilomyces variotii]KAJ9274920.1 hypothetical protein DTO021D3_8188 [Paecilomyces variotii]KAJ9339412.1 hypothetical protein DTO027B6_8066 [Paecilomyces variotii]KAJ9348829.1 hypothetical protein DTO027B9_7972 [Paecilomyces variotii]
MLVPSSMKITLPLWSAWLLVPPVLAGALFQSALNGFPANPYDPFCAMSCLRSLYSLRLSCSSTGDTVGMMTMKTSSACWAENTPYLTSLAWCMHTKCSEYNVKNSKLEYFWETESTGQSDAGETGVPPKWSYTEALANITSPPTIQLTPEDTWLNDTSLVSPLVYEEQWNVLTSVQRETAQENAYGIAILVTGFGTPIVLTWAGYLPFLSTIFRKLKPYLVWPSLIGTYQVRPLPSLLGNAPTVGQTLYILIFLILNIVLTAVNFQSRQPNAWYSSTWHEIMAYVLYRTGAFAYIIAPLIWLFAGRNNILLWASNWSHSTFLVLHRWVARIFTLQVLLHSIIAVILYKAEGTYGEAVKSPYWIWGIVATLCCVLLTFGSGLYLRSYATSSSCSNILCSPSFSLSAAGTMPTIWRVLHIAIVCPHRAKVTVLNEEYVRIDILGIRWGSEPGRHVYVYFPGLHPLRPWENYPFSILPTALLQHSHALTASKSQDQVLTDGLEEQPDVEKHDVLKSGVTAVHHRHPTVGLTLYIRKLTGMTRSLRAGNNLLTFLEGPYPNNSTQEVLRCDRLLLIGGGIGITGVLPFVHNHWNVKQAWSVKESARCLVDDLEGFLSGFVANRDVRIGSRLNVKQLLEDEIEAGWEKVGIVVSGPGGLCDDVRAAVVSEEKLGKTEFKLVVEAYSW